MELGLLVYSQVCPHITLRVRRVQKQLGENVHVWW